MKKINKIAVLVISCDKYSDLWEPCSKMFLKFWPDCEFDKYLVSNFKECNLTGFINLKIGKDNTWSHGLKIALDKLSVNYDYVFTMVEDYYFVEKIDNYYVKAMFNTFVDLEGNFLSLFKLPSKLSKCNQYFGELENFIPYRQSIGFTLWKVQTLIKILDVNENAWEFEKNGVIRGFQFDKFYGSYKNFKVMNLVIKGKLVPKEYKALKTLFPSIEILRPSMSRKEVFIEKFREFAITTFLFITPAYLKRKIYFSRV